MPCDEGRARKVLTWILIDGKGDDDFRQWQRNAQAGVASGSEGELLSAIDEMESDHDFGSYVACKECSGNLIKWGREIMGIGP